MITMFSAEGKHVHDLNLLITLIKNDKIFFPN